MKESVSSRNMVWLLKKRAKKGNENLEQNIEKKHNKCPWKIWSKYKNAKKAKDKVYSPCILLSRSKFMVDILEIQRNPDRIAKTFTNTIGQVIKLSYRIRYVQYLTHNTINKNFARLALLNKIS